MLSIIGDWHGAACLRARLPRRKLRLPPGSARQA